MLNKGMIKRIIKFLYRRIYKISISLSICLFPYIIFFYNFKQDIQNIVQFIIISIWIISIHTFIFLFIFAIPILFTSKSKNLKEFLEKD